MLDAAGFQIVPTSRTPHVTIAFDGDVQVGLQRQHLRYERHGALVPVTQLGFSGVLRVREATELGSHQAATLHTPLLVDAEPAVLGVDEAREPLVLLGDLDIEERDAPGVLVTFDTCREPSAFVAVEVDLGHGDLDVDAKDGLVGVTVLARHAKSALECMG